jgi:hypothetical protein
MPIASLSNFSVPLVTNNSSPNQGLLMPKLSYRFRVTMFGFGAVTSVDSVTEVTKQVMSVDRPQPSFEEIPLHVYNSTVKLQGKYKWNNIKLKVRDDVTNAVTTVVGQQVQKQFDFFNQSSGAAGQDYKFSMIIEILDGGNGAAQPITLEAFELDGCWLKQVTYDAVDYAKNDPLAVEMEICYDNATQIDAAGGNLIAIPVRTSSANATQ